jgi:hypothetical protein
MWAWDVIGHLVVGEGISPVFLATTAVFVAALAIVWHAWKWPKVRDGKPSVEVAVSPPAATAARQR